MSTVAMRIVLIIGLYLASSVAVGQSREWCPDDVFPYDANHELTLGKLADSSGANEYILANEWQRANELLVNEFRRFVSEKRLDPTSAKLSLFLDEVDRYLAARIPPIRHMKATFNDAIEQEGRLVWDFGMDSDNQSITLSLSCNALPRNEEDRAIAYFADALYEYGRSDQWAAVKIGSAEISRIYSTHKNRLTNGLPMWPQETWINGLNVDFDTDEPVVASNTQWIFLRPSISPALKFSGEDSSELDAALMLEPLGFIKYRDGSDFRRWHGASAIVTMSGDNGVGYGAIYRYDSLIIGAAHHSRPDEWMLYVSLDLYDLVVPKDGRTNDGDEFLKRLAAHLKDEAIKGVGE
jgi:hypothetical protein